MSTYPVQTAPGYKFATMPDFSQVATRERLSQSAIEGFFAIIDRWGINLETAGELLGGVPRSSVYKLRSAAGTLKQDELMRISYMVGIFKALHILLPEGLADEWMTRPNDNPLFVGTSPLAYVVRGGIPAMQQVRSLLDAARGGQ